MYRKKGEINCLLAILRKNIMFFSKGQTNKLYKIKMFIFLWLKIDVSLFIFVSLKIHERENYKVKFFL